MQATASMGVQGLPGMDGAGRRPSGLRRVCAKRQVSHSPIAASLRLSLSEATAWQQSTLWESTESDLRRLFMLCLVCSRCA